MTEADEHLVRSNSNFQAAFQEDQGTWHIMHNCCPSRRASSVGNFGNFGHFGHPRYDIISVEIFEFFNFL